MQRVVEALMGNTLGGGSQLGVFVEIMKTYVTSSGIVASRSRPKSSALLMHYLHRTEFWLARQLQNGPRSAPNSLGDPPSQCSYVGIVIIFEVSSESAKVETLVYAR